MNLELIEAIKILASFQALLFAAYLLSSKRNRNTANYFISIFLIVLGINTSVFIQEIYILPYFPTLHVAINISFFLMPASLFLYNKFSLQTNAKVTRKELIHLVPFILINVIVLPSVYIENSKENPTETAYLKILQLALYILFYVLIFIYQYLSFQLLKKNKEHYFENYSNNDLRKYKYLKDLNIIFTVMFVISAIKNFFVFQEIGVYTEALILTINFSLLLFFCWIIYKGLQSPELFRQPKETLPPVKKMVEQNKTSTNENENAKALEQIKTYMSNEQPFLDPSLSIQDLARQTSMKAKDLSLLINNYLGKHFFDFVNEYRINKAIEILKDPSQRDLTVLEIMYDVGFNSKSSFNTSFKNQTGLTPTQYRKSQHS